MFAHDLAGGCNHDRANFVKKDFADPGKVLLSTDHMSAEKP